MSTILNSQPTRGGWYLEFAAAVTWKKIKGLFKSGQQVLRVL